MAAIQKTSYEKSLLFNISLKPESVYARKNSKTLYYLIKKAFGPKPSPYLWYYLS